MKDAIRVIFEYGDGKDKLMLVRYISFEEMKGLAGTPYPGVCLERELMGFWDDLLMMGKADAKS